MCSNCSKNFGSQKLRFEKVFKGPGGCKNLGEACRIRFRISWYLSDSVVPSYDQKTQKQESIKVNDYFNVSVIRSKTLDFIDVLDSLILN